MHNCSLDSEWNSDVRGYLRFRQCAPVALEVGKSDGSRVPDQSWSSREARHQADEGSEAGSENVHAGAAVGRTRKDWFGRSRQIFAEEGSISDPLFVAWAPIYSGATCFRH